MKRQARRASKAEGGGQRARPRYLGRVLSPRANPVAVLAVAALAAGCGDDDPVPADEPPALTQAAPPVTTTQPEPAPPPAPAQTRTTAAGPECGAIGELRLRVVAGEAGCDEVRRIAAGYDLAGAKVQEIGGWTCASGTAQTRPVVFTCTRGGAEFVARESGE